MIDYSQLINSNKGVDPNSNNNILNNEALNSDNRALSNLLNYMGIAPTINIPNNNNINVNNNSGNTNLLNSNVAQQQSQQVQPQQTNPSIDYFQQNTLNPNIFNSTKINSEDLFPKKQAYNPSRYSGFNPKSAPSTGKYSAIKSYQNIQHMIVDTANKYGIDPSIALAMGHIESGFNPNAQSKYSSAKGVYQFLDATARRYGILGKQLDPAANIDAGMRLFKDNYASFMRQFGRPPSAGEIYLFHQQGEAGASALLKNPNANVVSVLSKFKSKSYNPIAVVTKNGGNVNMTAGQFANLWIQKGNALQQIYKNQLGGK